VIYNLPLSNWNSSLNDTSTFYDVFYYNSLVMYKLFYDFDSSINGESVLTERRHYFFVFHKDSLYGYTYYPNRPHLMAYGRLRVNSLLEKNSLESNNFDTLLSIKPDSSYYEADGNLVKIYNPPIRKGDFTDYTLYLYYTKTLNGIKETFSKKMDNIKDMKLFRIRILPKKAYKNVFPKKEILYEMKEAPVENQQEVLAYFNKYRKEHLKN